MIKNYSLILIAFLCCVGMGFGQISITGLGAGNTYSQDFNTLASSGTSNTVPAGWAFSESGSNANTTYTAGTGSSNSGDTYSYGSSSERSFGGLLSSSLSPTIGVSFTNNTGYVVTELNISYTGEQWRLGATGRVDRLDFQYSVNATSLTTGTWIDENNLDFNAPNSTGTAGTLDGNLIANKTSITYTITGLSIADGSSFWLRWNDFNATSSDDGLAIDDFSIYVLGATDEVDWCNLQFPPSTTILDGTVYNVYAQVEEASYINGTGGPYPLITAWIGYSTVDSDPTDPGNNSDWSWEEASFNVDISGTRAEYIFDLASILPSGTYYYCSRFQYNGGPYKYGGYSGTGGGFWQSGVNVNQQLIITPDQVNFCNVDYPKNLNITTGHSDFIFAQAYEPGVTDSAGPGANLEAWIGYNTIGEDYEPWQSTGWTWIQATYNPSCLNCNSGQNDEFYVEIGCGLPAGTYYYASRFQLNGSDYSYGGIRADNVGNFWDYAPNDNNGTLIVTDPPLADVVITEIMYNSSGTDDEWIEICNVSGSTQDISNYIIDVGGSLEFIFPCGTTILSGDCMTIALGDNGTAPFNPDCSFTQDFGTPSTTNNLTNTSGATITIFAANGTTPADVVTYNVNDGGDGNGSSLHVIDVSQDNSDTGSNWQEVDLGGSAGVNSLVPNCVPTVAEINVEGNLASYPDISDGDTTPSPFDNTQFAAQYIGSSQAKSYRIQNLGGFDLTISNITITGDTGDFTITSNPSSPVVYGTPSILEITFSPIAVGIRTAVVHIFNNDDNTDGDTEEEYTFTIQGVGLCSTNSNTITPSSGPVGTVITVNGTNLTTATASFNGISATVNNISNTLMEIIVPNGAVTGNIEIVDDQPCTSFIPFTIIDSQIGGCEGSSSLTEIFISEVTDATYGGLSYVELYNATGADVDLSNYSLELYQNGNTDTSDTNNYKTQTLSGTIGNNQTYTIAIGNDNYDCPVPGGDASYADLELSIIGGINKPVNGHDYLGLYNSLTSTIVDEFGIFGDNNWMDSVHTSISGTRGFNFRRLNTATPLPNQTFDDDDWVIIDWAGSGSDSCSTNDYSDIGTYDFSTGVPPSITVQPTAPNSSCDLSATISVTATEGFVGGNSLAYQWYYNIPGTNSWAEVMDGAIYSGANTATLTISNTLGLNNYQYYCEVREDDATCYQASNAVRLTVDVVTWDGSTWSNGTGPDINTIAIIDGNYNTSAGINNQISFSACNLIVNSGTLTIANSNFVEVANDVSVNVGAIQVNTQGAFIQQGIGSAAGSFTLNGGTSQVSKFTAPLANWYDYTYWSSPVANELVSNALAFANPNRRFWFNANNYLDLNNDNIDDDANDWTLVGGISDPYNSMTAGRGYAATHNTIGFIPNTSYQYIFEGALNTGDISYPLSYNNANTDHWNLIGNPYPCALDINELFSVNSGVIKQVAYVWSHYRAPLATNPGNEVLNFNQSDYLTFNASGELGNGSDLDGDGDIDSNDIPERYIASGQGFFVSSLANSNIVFNNDMRISGENSNLQFFRQQIENDSPERFWINLNSDNGAYSQLLIAYLDGASDNNDGSAYDAKRLTTDNASSIYSLIESEPESKFSIQAKNTNSLSLEEVIPIGFNTNIQSSTIYTLKLLKISGDFISTNDIYIHDIYLQLYHNLSESDYNFTSEPGEFNDRFEIVFQTTALSTDDTVLSTNDLTIIELPDGSVKFKVGKNHAISQVEIIDLLGRTLYTLKGTGSEEIYFLPQLSQSAYIAKVTLNNGQTLSKKAIKKN